MDKKTFLMFLLLTLALLPSVFSIDFPLDVPRTLTTSSDQSYSYENTNGFFQVWYGDDPSTGNVVKFQADGVEMTLLPMELNWNNDLSQIQQISMPQSVSGVPSGSDMLYSNAYGSGRHLKYETQQDKVKEKIILDSQLPAPAQYVIDGGNPQLEIGFQLASDGKIFLDGVEWDKASEVETTNDVVVKDSSDNVVYTLPRPFATDSADETVFGKYIFKESANKLYVRMYIPYSWLNDSARIYPVTIDPTFFVDYSPIPALHITNLISHTEADSDGIATDVTAGVSDYNDSTAYTVVRANNGQVLVGKWGMSIYLNYTGYDFFLGVRKPSTGDAGTPYVYPYLADNDTINTTFYNTYTTSFAGINWFYYNVTNLIKYEYENGNGHIQLRFFPTGTTTASEMLLRVETNDTTAPVITNCTVNATSLGCDESALLQCNVTDNVAVEYVNFTIDSTIYQTTANGDYYYYILGQTGAGNYTYNWNDVYAEDLFGQYSNYDPNITFNYYCCIENWVADPYTCLTNDSYLLTYTDTNACGTTDDLPANNGTYQYCNYCSEQLVQILGDCQQNNSQSVDYIDLNYITCCAVTGLVSDCSILYYPYNETTSQYCMYFNNTMTTIECQNEPNFNLREKEYCLSYIPNQYLNETFKCISHVKDQVTGEILQTNPEYRERAQSFIDLFKQDPETREWFTPASAIVNFYYTQKNLNPETDYILTIECASPQRTLRSSMLFQMAYEDYEFVFFRTRWLMANAGYIIAGLIVILIIMFVLFLIWRTGKG